MLKAISGAERVKNGFIIITDWCPDGARIFVFKLVVCDNCVNVFNGVIWVDCVKFTGEIGTYFIFAIKIEAIYIFHVIKNVINCKI